MSSFFRGRFSAQAVARLRATRPKKFKRTPPSGSNPRLRKKKNRPSASAPILARKFKSVRVNALSHGSSQSWFTHKMNPTPAFKVITKVNQSNWYVTNQSYRLSTGAGAQGFQEFGMFTGGTFGGTNYNSDLAVIVGKITASTGSGSTGRTTNVALQSCSNKMMIANNESTPVVVTLYDVVCRRDDITGPYNAFSFGVYDESTTTSNGHDLGSTPFNSQLFTTKYKILKKSEIILPCGSVHEHNVFYAPRKVFKAEILTNANQSLEGLTVYTFIVYKGTPENDPALHVNTSGATLDIVITKSLRYTFSSDTTANFSYTNNLPTFTGTGQTINEIGSVIQDIVA